MANRRSTFTNAFETTLASAISGSDTSMTLASATGLTAPTYLVLDPDDPAKREYVYVSTLVGTQATLAERHLAGSAAGSGLSHAAGATVRSSAVAQELDDVHDRLEALTLDHGAQLTGLSDDDHQQYHNDARADQWLEGKSTSDLAEGSRLYYTDGRVDARIEQTLSGYTRTYEGTDPQTQGYAEATGPGATVTVGYIGPLFIPVDWNTYDLICTVSGAVYDNSAGSAITAEIWFNYEGSTPAYKHWVTHPTGATTSFSYTATLTGLTLVGTTLEIHAYCDPIAPHASTELRIERPVIVAHFVRTS